MGDEIKKFGRFFVLLAIVSLVIAGTCYSMEGNKGPVVKEWNIPFISILTGPVAFAGLPAVWGAEYAAKQINAAGGINGVPVKITRYDTAFDPAKAVSAMGRLIDDSLLILGPMDGPGATAAGPVAAENNVPFVAAVTRPDLREKCMPWGVSYMQDSADGSIIAVREWIKLNPDIKSVVVFYMPSDPAQVEEYKLITEQMKKDGVKSTEPSVWPVLK
ncbi:ABC transporter substrate-binding protein, partial [Thermodesulfobacteriota bacterium]